MMSERKLIEEIKINEVSNNILNQDITKANNGLSIPKIIHRVWMVFNPEKPISCNL